ncbi:cyclic nucleotide-binding domain-containing protein [Humisphaera borealis]|uniref:Cyclic nucleotide-binding domain-containing protein n=1 Tax=Humisphaera borealis TaxID=2807512 RepID=A0A7M2WUI3_9BACT|nr:cyclic nucleotide-binding domain-containing protein [Humisphaera borealis]QOV88200.1 cyclic nucleotide-binding domain-containing protein [Humisphaera borealis]
MDSKFLEGIPLFSSLTPLERDKLAVYFEVRQVAMGTTLFWVGEIGDEFFLIKRGQVSISVPDQGGKEIILADLGPGAVFGEIALLDSGPRTATARARSDAEVLVLQRSAFADFITEHPPFALHVMKVLGTRQRQTVEKLRGIRNLDEIIEERLTRWEQIATGIATMASSKWFLLTHAVAFVSWIIANLVLPPKVAIDPFPFPFLCFWASTEAIFLSLFILVAQDQQSRKDRTRTELEYQVALKMQVEMMQLHQKLDTLIDGQEADLERRRKEDKDIPRSPLHLTLRTDLARTASDLSQSDAAV